MLWIRTSRSPLAECPTFISTPFPISKSFHLALPTTKCSPHEGVKVSAWSFQPIIIKGKVNLSVEFFSSKHFFFFLAWKLYSHIYTSSVSSLNFRVDLNFIIIYSWHLGSAVSERRIIGTYGDTAVFLVSGSDVRDSMETSLASPFLYDFSVHGTGTLWLKMCWVFL